MSNTFETLSLERKSAQEDGKYPDWFTTQGYQMFKDKYEFQADGYNEQVERIAKHLAQFAPTFPEKGTVIHTKLINNYGGNWEDVFANLFKSGHLAPSSPLLANGGTDRGSPVSCSGSYVHDSIRGFYEAQMEAALLSKESFGTSAYLGDIRHRGAPITKGGKASGSFPVLQDFQTVAKKVSQGNTRRGSWAGYLEIEHGDFDEWCDTLIKNPADQNIGWIIGRDFIKRLKEGDEDAVERFSKTLYCKLLTGKGYYWKRDHVNEQQPAWYKEKGYFNKASNLCVAPETMILTKDGYIPIAELEDTSCQVWNGVEWSHTTIRRTSDNSKLVKVITNSGQELECTEYHKFYVQNNYGSEPEMVRAKDLQVGDKLIKFDLPLIEGKLELHKAYENGFFSGDGCVVSGKNRIYLYHEKKALEKFFDLQQRVEQTKHKRVYGYESGLKDKFFVPSSEYTIKSRLDWLAGISDADGTIARNGTNESLQICSTEKEFLKEVQLMLQTLGVTSKVTQCHEAGVRLMPTNDGTGELKEYDCKSTYRLLVSSSGLFKLSQLGFRCNRLVWEVRKPQRCAEQFIKVLNVVDEGRYDGTFCFTEGLRGMGMFGGLLTGQCTEITLPANEEETYSCVLSSMNARYFDDWKHSGGVFAATVLLDCLCSSFVGRAKDIEGLEKVVKFTERHRALGLGCLGFHTYLQEHNFAFGDLQSKLFNIELFSHLDSESLEASKWMAEKWGEPEVTEGHGVRNTTRLAVAPNMSSSVLAGGVSQGIEPIIANAYLQESAAGEMQRINPTFLELAKKKGRYDKKIIRSVIEAKGSVQQLDWLTDEEKLIFRTAFEIPQSVIVEMASERQPFIDQGQSLNLFFDADEDEEYIAKIHKQAILDENIKGLYYLRTMKGVHAAKDECLSCEG